MPSAVYASTSDSIEATALLAIEDFLHVSVKGLWERFWAQEDGPLPFSISCLHSSSSKFYPAEKAIAEGQLSGLCATAIFLKNNKNNERAHWDQIVELALVRPDIRTLSHSLSDVENWPSLTSLGEALFFALRLLVSRSISRSEAVTTNSNQCFMLLVDSQFGGVVKVNGQVNKLKFDSNDVYESAAEWIKKHALVRVSSIERIWNKLGNANWGDLGTLQLLLATFHSMIQFCGEPTRAIEELANQHSYHLRSRRLERELPDDFHFRKSEASTEIVEVQEEEDKVEERKIKTKTKKEKKKKNAQVEVGSVLWIEDSDWRKGFQVSQVLENSDFPVYCACSLEDPEKPLFLYVGSSASQLEPAWEDMNLWYQVQRQTKILTLMKQKGLSSQYLPELIASGKLMQSGESTHGQPILVTSPFGQTVAELVREGAFDPNEALRCCHDCLAALSVSAAVGIRHGDIRPETVIRANLGSRASGPAHYAVVGWGHAVVEERDRPAMNLYFSSTQALQEGRLCGASDAESLVYLIYYAIGGGYPELDSVEEALQWREISWSRRVIQQSLGETSAVLKAFADYVDSLCGTPYPLDYGIWLRRMRRALNEDEYGKSIDGASG